MLLLFLLLIQPFTVNLDDIRVNKLNCISTKQQTLVTFTFDDQSATQYSRAKPIFDARGVVGTIFIVTNWTFGGGNLSWIQLKEFQNDGWEIGSHSHTHPHLIALSETEIRNELSLSKRILEDSGFVIKNIAYPYGENDKTVRRIAREYYNAARGIVPAVNKKVLTTYALSSPCIDNHASLAIFKNYVDIAKDNVSWLIFYMHGVTTEDSVTLDSLIGYIQSQNIPIVTMNQALGLIGNVIDAGDVFGVGGESIRASFIEGDVGIETANPEAVLHVYRKGDNKGTSIFENYEVSPNNFSIVTIKQTGGNAYWKNYHNFLKIIDYTGDSLFIIDGFGNVRTKGNFAMNGKILPSNAGDSLTKFIKIGSHCAVIINAADTFFLAADTMGF